MNRLMLVGSFLLSLIGPELFLSGAQADDQTSTTRPASNLTSPASRPSDADLTDRFVRAKTNYAAFTKARLAALEQTDEYKIANSAVETARQNCAAATGDDVPAAAENLMQALSVLHKLEQDALSHDPSIRAAKRELDAATTAAGGIERAELPTLNRAVLAYAEQSLGKVIGNGECWTLGNEAVLAAHARPPDVYAWGRELRPNDPVLPGDIMQFTSCRFQGSNWWLQLGFPNHTAIVQKVASKTVYWILGQNPGPVAQKRIDFQFLKSGSYKVYRPLPE